MTSFTVVSYVRESREIIERFVAYYSALGATEILIFTDGDADHLNGIDAPGLSLTECDNYFWNAYPGGRPESLEDAQSTVFMTGYIAATSDWVLIVDADEFAFGNLSLSDFLTRLPATTDVAILPTAEAVWGPSDIKKYENFSSTYFRVKITKCAASLTALLYGKSVARHFGDGLLGHSLGKQLLRTGRQFDSIRCHRSFRDDQKLGEMAAAIDPEFSNMYIAHFDAVGFDRWREKWQSRLDGDTNAAKMRDRRRGQMQLFETTAKQGTPALKTLFRKIFSLSLLQWWILSRLGLAFRKDLFTDKTAHSAKRDQN